MSNSIEYPSDFFDLYYWGTKTKVRLGDHVIFYRWIGLRKIHCRVCYIPGVSPPNKEMEYTKNAAMWAIEDNKGNAYSMLYVPNDKHISKHIKFVSRSNDDYQGMNKTSQIL